MFRLILVTLAGLYGILAWTSTPELSPQLAEAAARATTRQTAEGSVTLASLASGLKPGPALDQAPAEIRTVQPMPVAAEPEQAAPAARRFPGPPLEPSPEHAGRTADPATAGGTAAEATGAGTLTIAGDRVNLRSGPGTEHPSVGRLNRGTVVVAIGPTSGAWIEVRDEGGIQGFVSAKLLSPNPPD